MRLLRERLIDMTVDGGATEDCWSEHDVERRQTEGTTSLVKADLASGGSGAVILFFALAENKI